MNYSIIQSLTFSRYFIHWPYRVRTTLYCLCGTRWFLSIFLVSRLNTRASQTLELASNWLSYSASHTCPHFFRKLIANTCKLIGKEKLQHTDRSIEWINCPLLTNTPSLHLLVKRNLKRKNILVDSWRQRAKDRTTWRNLITAWTLDETVIVASKDCLTNICSPKADIVVSTSSKKSDSALPGKGILLIRNIFHMRHITTTL